MSTSTTDTATSTTFTGGDDAEQIISLPEIVSSLLDDEAGTFEQRRVLDELKAEEGVNDKLHAKLLCYALIGETMRSGKPAVTAGTDFLSGLHEQLESEPEYSSHVLDDNLKEEKTSHKKSWLQPVGGFAMAASVAALAVIGFQNYFVNSDIDNINTPSSTEILAVNALQDNGAKGNLGLTNKSRLSKADMDSAIVVSADSLQTNVKSPAIAMQDNGAGSSDTTYQQADARTRLLLKSYVDSHMQYASTTAFVPSIRVIAYSDY